MIVAAPDMPTLTARRREDLVTTMDIAATSLALAGLDVPETMDAKNVFASDYQRRFVFASQDRMSNTIDRVRSVMGRRFHYIRNFMTDRPLMQWGHREMIGASARPGRYGYYSTLREMYATGLLTPAQGAPYGPRPQEELYDLDADPHEVVNLASDPRYADQLTGMRRELAVWIDDTGDQGRSTRSRAAIKEVTDRYPKPWLKGPEFKAL